MSTIVPLARAREEATFGAKAVGLGDAVRAELPVPAGVALSHEVVDEVAAKHSRALRKLERAVRDLRHPVAVRSSCVDEDGAEASFAGQHLTVLNVASPADLPAAVREIWWSANSDSAITYRQRVGMMSRPRVGVVVQTLLDPKAAGVMFTINPVTGADERVIEASWGLGEAVVDGRVIPDRFRVDRSGAVIERTPGVKKIAVRSLPEGGTTDEDVAAELVEAPCLTDDDLARLHALAARCEQVYGPARDIEWAIDEGQVYLLQCRAITTGGSASPAPPAPTGPLDALAKVSLFADLTRRELDEISRSFKARHFSAGETVAKEGGGGAAFFVIESGEATVSIRGNQVATLGPGDHFGEIALIDEGARSATITATADLVCLGLTLWDFRPLVLGNPSISWKLLQTLARRLRDAQAAPPTT